MGSTSQDSQKKTVGQFVWDDYWNQFLLSAVPERLREIHGRARLHEMMTSGGPSDEHIMSTTKNAFTVLS